MFRGGCGCEVGVGPRGVLMFVKRDGLFTSEWFVF